MYAVIFTSQHSLTIQGYAAMATRMEELVKSMPGFIGVDSCRNENGFGITISYWKSLEDIKQWKANFEHQKAQQLGKERWYTHYKIKICKIEREYDFG